MAFPLASMHKEKALCSSLGNADSEARYDVILRNDVPFFWWLQGAYRDARESGLVHLLCSEKRGVVARNYQMQCYIRNEIKEKDYKRLGWIGDTMPV